MAEIRTAQKRTWSRPSLFIAIGAVLYAVLVIFINGGDSLALVTLGTRFTEGISEADGGTEGYDGQFVYFIAKDPISAPFYIARGGDIPAYRFQRMLLPTLGNIGSLGNDSLIPFSLLIINGLAVLVGGILLESLLRGWGISRWYVVGYALTLAIFGTVRLSLPEPLAYGLVIGGIFAMTKDKWLWGAWLFSLAAISKETTLVFVGGYALWMLMQKQFWQVIWFLGVSTTPFIVLQLMLYRSFGAFGVGSGGAMATSFEIIPFGGVLQIITTILGAMGVALSNPEADVMGVFIRAMTGLLVFAVLLGIFVIYPTLWGIKRLWADFRDKKIDVWSVLLGINAMLMLFVPFSTYREPLGILRFIAGLQIAVILYSAQRGNHRALRNSTFWMFTLLLLIGSDMAGGMPS
ncbi:MAG: hypothetical protein SH821_02360 [Phototrophicales bacterium]|nr:hypothetical protein [Phototrophicales bacterium]